MRTDFGFGPLGALAGLVLPALLAAQVPPQTDPRIYDIVAASSAQRVEADIRTRFTLEGVAADGRDGNESVVAFYGGQIQGR